MAYSSMVGYLSRNQMSSNCSTTGSSSSRGSMGSRSLNLARKNEVAHSSANDFVISEPFYARKRFSFHLNGFNNWCFQIFMSLGKKKENLVWFCCIYIFTYLYLHIYILLLLKTHTILHLQANEKNFDISLLPTHTHQHGNRLIKTGLPFPSPLQLETMLSVLSLEFTVGALF